MTKKQLNTIRCAMKHIDAAEIALIGIQKALEHNPGCSPESDRVEEALATLSKAFYITAHIKED